MWGLFGVLFCLLMLCVHFQLGQARPNVGLPELDHAELPAKFEPELLFEASSESAASPPTLNQFPYFPPSRGGDSDRSASTSGGAAAAPGPSEIVNKDDHEGTGTGNIIPNQQSAGSGIVGILQNNHSAAEEYPSSALSVDNRIALWKAISLADLDELEDPEEVPARSPFADSIEEGEDADQVPEELVTKVVQMMKDPGINAQHSASITESERPDAAEDVPTSRAGAVPLPPPDQPSDSRRSNSVLIGLIIQTVEVPDRMSTELDKEGDSEALTGDQWQEYYNLPGPRPVGEPFISATYYYYYYYYNNNDDDAFYQQYYYNDDDEDDDDDDDDWTQQGQDGDREDDDYEYEEYEEYYYDEDCDDCDENEDDRGLQQNDEFAILTFFK